MKFTKMQGTGNDFIIINNMEEKIQERDLSTTAADLCRRRYSIGADGFISIDHPRANGDFRIDFFNADGSVGEMCGNGARCAARYGFEKGLAGTEQIIETMSGLVLGKRISEREYRVRLNNISKIEIDKVINLNGQELKCSYVEMGVPGLPHVVINHDNLREADLDSLRETGRELRYNKAFAKGANINFYEILTKNHIIVRTYERGVEDLTLACGTGSASTVAVLSKRGETNSENIRVSLLGGDLKVDIYKDNDTGQIYLTGDTKIVAEGNTVDL